MRELTESEINSAVSSIDGVMNVITGTPMFEILRVLLICLCGYYAVRTVSGLIRIALIVIVCGALYSYLR